MTDGRGARVPSIDLIRGAVMVLMAVDHVRVFAGVPAGGPDPAVFFTRWITHFCAPAFVFFAGTGAFFYGRRHGDLKRYLLIRGALLILIELTFMRFAWTFNFDFRHYEMAGVLWVIGWSMIVLAALVAFPRWLVLAFALAVTFGHNVLDGSIGGIIQGLDTNPLAWLWKIAYVGFSAGPIQAGPDGPMLIVLYSLIPWIGVMAAGYAFGAIVDMPAEKRRKSCLTIGLGAVALFLVLRAVGVYGDPRPWGGGAAGGHGPPMPGWLSFLNATKYPASLEFLLMTLGPTIALLGVLDGARGWVARALMLFGRVPFFFYLLHVPLIHLLAMIVSVVRQGSVDAWLFANHPMGNPPPPDGYTWSLPLLYAVWAVAIAILYPACRWFARVKARSPAAWLRFV